MPIFDQGYQHWKGTLSGHTWRWLAVTRHGVRVQMKNRWPRLVLLFAWFPALVLVTALALMGLAEKNPDLLAGFLQMFGLPTEIARTPETFRASFWIYAYKVFFDVEVFFSMLLVLMVGPDLISQDLRFNALPLYFSRPLRRTDYFLGKLGVIGFFLGAVTVVPAAAAYLLGVAFSLNLGVVRDTFPLFLGAVAYGVVVALAAGTLMLGLSSLSRNSRYVGAFWIGVWFVGGILAVSLSETIRAEWCPLLSFTGNLERVGDRLLDVESAQRQFDTLLQRGGHGGPPRRLGPPQPPWTWSAAVLVGLMGLSLWTLSLRVKSLDRLK